MSELLKLAFSEAEYRQRLTSVQASLAKRGMNALLLNSRADICYLTGMENGYLVAYYAAIIPAHGEPILLASDFEILNAELTSWCRERVTFPVSADAIAVTCQALAERGFARARIGVQFHSLTAEQYQGLQRGLLDVEFVKADDILAPLKVIKSPAEIAYLRESGRLSALGIKAAIEHAAPGKTENDLAAIASQVMIQEGSEYMCLDPIVTAGRRSGVPHSTFRRNRLQAGDAVLLEVGACICRYTAPLMRTVALSPVSADVRRAADACRDSLNALVEHMRPGAVASEVAAKAKAAWQQISEELIWHGIYAYSVGLGFPPDWNDALLCITLDADFTLEPGMCFHATTSLRRPCEFGIGLSETVLITEEGNEVLTGTKRELAVI